MPEPMYHERCAKAGIPGKCVTVTHAEVGDAPVFLCRKA